MRNHLIASLLLMPLAGLPGQPIQTGQATGRIAGTIVEDGTNQPVRFAKVTLGSSSGDSQVLTDDSGGFAFEGLRAGAYKLHILKPGYLATAYGQLRPGTNTIGRDIVLQDRQRLERLVIPVSHGGSISGVVRDDRGEPAFRATVVVSRWRMQNGLRALETIAQTQTDERGNYRLSLLPPRDYILSAVPADDAIPSIGTNPNPYGFATVFYPGQMSAQAAESIAIGLGEERTNINLQVPAVPLGKVTGVVVSGEGQPVAGARVMLSVAGSSGTGLAASTDATGRFTFPRVLPGAYVANVRVNAPPPVSAINRQLAFQDFTALAGELQLKGEAYTMMFSGGSPAAKPGTPPPPGGAAASDVTVAGSSASEVLLTLEPLRSVSGRVVFDGSSRKPTEVLVSLPGLAGAPGIFNVKTAPDGTFTIPNVAPGRYTITVGVSSPWEIASATAGGIDVLDFSLEMSRGRDIGDLTITFRDRPIELSGSVTDSAGQLVGDRTVVVFAADERLWPFGHSRIQANSLYEGRFVFSRFRPGTYRIAVVEGVEPEEWLDPDFLKRLVPASVLVTLADGDKKTQDLRVK